MLSDTTILEPMITNHFEKTVKYYLTGITALGETCQDSVTLNFSDWSIVLIDKIIGKLSSDTVQLWSATVSNWPHIQYERSPNYMISDTTTASPLVWNDTTFFMI